MTEAHLWDEFSKVVKDIYIDEEFATLVSKELKKSHLKALGERKNVMETLNQSISANKHENSIVLDLFVAGRLMKKVIKKN